MSSNISPENEQFIASAVSRGDFRDRFEVLNAGVEILKRKQAMPDPVASNKPPLEPPQNRDHHDDLQQLSPSIAAINEIVTLTNDFFPGKVRVEISVDPEFPEWPCVVFHVREEHKVANIDEVIDRELQWHAQVAKLAPESVDRLRLLIE